jgi:putative ABC transport system permease protein
MNVMFAGVAERQKEIGIMLSIGARKRDVLLQFLIESVILTVLGGLIGVLLGEITMTAFNRFSPYRVIPSPDGIVLALSFAIATGITF